MVVCNVLLVAVVVVVVVVVKVVEVGEVVMVSVFCKKLQKDPGPYPM